MKKNIEMCSHSATVGAVPINHWRRVLLITHALYIVQYWVHVLNLIFNFNLIFGVSDCDRLHLLKKSRLFYSICKACIRT